MPGIMLLALTEAPAWWQDMGLIPTGPICYDCNNPATGTSVQLGLQQIELDRNLGCPDSGRTHWSLSEKMIPHFWKSVFHQKELGLERLPPDLVPPSWLWEAIWYQVKKPKT